MNDDDLRIEFKRGHGPGGQHKNKVETCVVITHIPTGFKETCQDTRSRARNLTLAKARIKKRLDDAAKEAKLEKQNTLRKSLIQNQKTIRTYNFARREVKDHRTGKKYNLNKFLNGDVDFGEIAKDII